MLYYYKYDFQLHYNNKCALAMTDTVTDDAFTPHDHTECQSRVMEQAEKMLAAQGARLTPVRRRTLEILLESHSALGAYQVLERLAESGFGRQPPVAYRALEFLIEHGLVHRLQRLNAYTACLHPTTDHAPVFLICRKCDKVAEAHFPQLRAGLVQSADAMNFGVERATIEASGICSSCSALAAE